MAVPGRAHGPALGHGPASGRDVIIYNRRIWASYRAEEGWRPYVGANPHTDDIHFSFSWAGARKQTSYWDGTPVTSSRTGGP